VNTLIWKSAVNTAYTVLSIVLYASYNTTSLCGITASVILLQNLIYCCERSFQWEPWTTLPICMCLCAHCLCFPWLVYTVDFFLWVRSFVHSVLRHVKNVLNDFYWLFLCPRVRTVLFLFVVLPFWAIEDDFIYMNTWNLFYNLI